MKATHLGIPLNFSYLDFKDTGPSFIHAAKMKPSLIQSMDKCHTIHIFAREIVFTLDVRR